MKPLAPVPPLSRLPPLPPLPRISLRVARDRTSESSATGGFLNVRRIDLVATAPDGRDSPPFRYDVATRASLDAVVMAAHYVDGGVHQVFLRSAVRPALAVREVWQKRCPPHDGALWELPAGLIDGDESPAEAAARELAEELGFELAPASLVPLGHPVFPAPGFIAEMHYFFHVQVDPGKRLTPSEDGSALEKDASIISVPLGEALEHCRSGAITDAKTELLLRRLVEELP
jgi:ADP-ribose pyrophosphatase